MKTKLILQKIFIFLLLHGITIGVLSGQWAWRGGWLFILLLTSSSLIASGLLFSNQQDLVKERWGTKTNIKPWDQWLMPLVAIIIPFLAVVLGSLEVRFAKHDCASVCCGMQMLGCFIGALSCWILASSILANRFFSTHVRIQTERCHQVINSGPYRLIRHPGYISMILYAISIPLILGSIWAIPAVCIMIILVVLRTFLEDKVLIQELKGYKAYSIKVPFRLVPWVW